MYYELPIGCFVAAILVLIPLPWHWHARNVPTLSIIAWLFAVNLIDGVNSIVWAGNVAMRSPVWCDIATKIQIGGNFALPVSCLCLCIHLERISAVRQAQSTLDQKKRRMLLDIFLCWILPMIYMALHFIVQGHRFDIIEDFGCRPTIYDSVPSFFLVWTPPLLAVAGTAVYASLALHHFFQRRLSFARHLQEKKSTLTPSRYFRLMAMAIMQIIWTTFIISIYIAFMFRHGLRPWNGWADVHSNFSRVAQFPRSLIPLSDLRWTYVLWWSVRISAVFFFAFFAFGQEAVREYKSFFGRLLEVIYRPVHHFCLKRQEKSSLPLFSPVSPPASSMYSESKFTVLTLRKSDPHPPYCLSNLGETGSLLVTPGAQVHVSNDTSRSFTIVLHSA